MTKHLLTFVTLFLMVCAGFLFFGCKEEPPPPKKTAIRQKIVAKPSKTVAHKVEKPAVKTVSKPVVRPTAPAKPPAAQKAVAMATPARKPVPTPRHGSISVSPTVFT